MKLIDKGNLILNTSEFPWLIQHLTSPNVHIKGCQVNFPETVFMKSPPFNGDDGKVEFMIFSDKEGYLRSITNPDMLQIYR